MVAYRPQEDSDWDEEDKDVVLDLAAEDFFSESSGPVESSLEIDQEIADNYPGMDNKATEKLKKKLHREKASDNKQKAHTKFFQGLIDSD